MPGNAQTSAVARVKTPVATKDPKEANVQCESSLLSLVTKVTSNRVESQILAELDALQVLGTIHL